MLLAIVKGDTRAPIGHVLSHGARAPRAVPHTLTHRKRERARGCSATLAGSSRGDQALIPCRRVARFGVDELRR